MKTLEAIYFGEKMGGDLTSRDQLAAVIRRLPYRDLVRVGGEMGKKYDGNSPDDSSTDLTRALDAWAATVAVEWDAPPPSKDGVFEAHADPGMPENAERPPKPEPVG